MRPPGPEEQWVAAGMAAALGGIIVQHHDDGTRPSMHDLDLVRDGHAFAACEVTAAADADCIELWNLINGRAEPWIEPNLDGGWMLSLSPKCRAKNLFALAPAILARLESDPADSDARTKLRDLGVHRARKGETNVPGSINVTIARDSMLTTTWEASHGETLVVWLDDWIAAPEQAHNLEKLAAASRTENHLVVLLPGFTVAPASVSTLLMRNDAPLPNTAPNLPQPLTHLWVISTWTSGRIFHWDSSRWTAFPKPSPGRPSSAR